MSAALTAEGRGTRPLAFATLCVASLFMYGVNNALMALSPLFVSDLGFGMAAAGMQGSVFVAAAVAFRFLLMPRASSGVKRYLVVGSMSFCLACALLPSCQAFWQFLIARIVQSVGLALYWPCALSAAIALSDSERTGGYLGIYRLCTSISLAVGPSFAFAVVSADGYGSAFFCMEIASAAACAIVALLPVGKVDGGKDAFGNREVRVSGLAKGAPFFLAVSFVVSLGHGLMTNFSSVYVSDGYPGVNAGVCVACFSVGGIVASPLVGCAADRLPWRMLLLLCVCALGVGIALVGVSDGMALLLAAAAIAGFGSSASTVCILRGIAGQFEGRTRASVLGWQQNCVDVGIMASSCCFGLLLDATAEQSAVFIGWGMVSLLASCSILCFMRPDGRNR